MWRENKHQRSKRRKRTDAARVRERDGLTDGLRGNQVTEEGGKHDKDHGIADPGEVLERHVPLKLPVYPLIS